jgi:small GTP-binding protein
MEDLPPAKVIMLGDSSVGKTSIVLQLHKSKFDPHSQPTVGAAYVTKVMTTESGEQPLQIWDTAGQERFKSVIPLYVRGCAAVVLVCAADSTESFSSLDDWLRLLNESVPDLQHIFLAVNKVDRPPQFDFATAVSWAKNHRAKVFQTCAMQRDTVLPVFQAIAEDIAGSEMACRERASPIVIDRSSTRRGCC